MERLQIINFGAIKNADIEIKKYNIFIGDTSSGKSTVAKLITIFGSRAFYNIKDGDFESFSNLLERYNIDFIFEDTSIIKYFGEDCFWEIGENKFHTNFHDYNLPEPIDMSKYKEILQRMEERTKNILDTSVLSILTETTNNKYHPIYIPAERILISTFTNSIFSLLQAGASIPTCIQDFGSAYEKARAEHGNIDIDIMNINVSFSKMGDTILLKEDGRKIKFSQSSSGMQSIIPLWVVFNQYINIKNKGGQLLVIEEPELNLFPTTQVALINWIMKNMRESEGRIVITTHSPYILSTIDNLILANEVFIKNKNNEKTLMELEKLLPSMALVNFDDVSSYFFESNGKVSDIADHELKSIGAEHIDDASNQSGALFNQLCKLEDNEL
jgi:predicted ATP-dependent endonuclease of OLD family